MVVSSPRPLLPCPPGPVPSGGGRLPRRERLPAGTPFPLSPSEPPGATVLPSPPPSGFDGGGSGLPPCLPGAHPHAGGAVALKKRPREAGGKECATRTHRIRSVAQLRMLPCGTGFGAGHCRASWPGSRVKTPSGVTSPVAPLADAPGACPGARPRGQARRFLPSARAGHPDGACLSDFTAYRERTDRTPPYPLTVINPAVVGDCSRVPRGRIIFARSVLNAARPSSRGFGFLMVPARGRGHLWLFVHGTPLRKKLQVLFFSDATVFSVYSVKVHKSGHHAGDATGMFLLIIFRPAEILLPPYYFGYNVYLLENQLQWISLLYPSMLVSPLGNFHVTRFSETLRIRDTVFKPQHSVPLEPVMLPPVHVTNGYPFPFPRFSVCLCPWVSGGESRKNPVFISACRDRVCFPIY